MKKFISLLLTFILIFTFSVTSFAVVSPSGKEYNDVYINRTHTGKSSETVEHVAVEDGKDIKIIPGDSELDFIGWNFYDEDMKPAKEGTDYKIVSITKKDGSAAKEGTDYTLEKGKIVSKNGVLLTIVVEPTSSPLYVSENFKGVDIEFNIEDGESLSPVTSDNVNVALVSFLSVLALVAAAFAITTGKKVFSK